MKPSSYPHRYDYFLLIPIVAAVVLACYTPRQESVLLVSVFLLWLLAMFLNRSRSVASGSRKHQRHVLCSAVRNRKLCAFRHHTSAGQERHPVALQLNDDIFGQGFVVRANV